MSLQASAKRLTTGDRSVYGKNFDVANRCQNFPRADNIMSD
ncbi:MAG: hypothetical protein RMY64_22760 [Nostoc sp. DedQUE08]|nr:hypothetical protein [Nostoc sp. DedQUE08]